MKNVEKFHDASTLTLLLPKVNLSNEKVWQIGFQIHKPRCSDIILLDWLRNVVTYYLCFFGGGGSTMTCAHIFWHQITVHSITTGHIRLTFFVHFLCSRVSRWWRPFLCLSCGSVLFYLRAFMATPIL